MRIPGPHALLLAATASAAALAAAWGTASRAEAEPGYTVTRVTFQGNAQVPTSELQAALPVGVGQTIDRAGLQADTDALMAVYRRHNVGTRLSTRMTTLHGRAQIAYTLAEQAPVAPTVVHVGITADHVAVSGNAQVKTADILLAANIHPGDTLTNERIRAAQDAVVALYKRSNVGASVSTDWTDAAAPHHVDVVFKVVEKAPD